jgi:transposase-like protein
VRRIDEETRQAIADVAEVIEEGPWEVNRRALAREFGVSPQTVARILDGPDARRGAEAASTPPASHCKGRFVLVAGVLGLVMWRTWRRLS